MRLNACLGRLAVLAALAAACSAPSGSSSLPRQLPGGKPDIPAMRALLQRCCPMGQYIVSTQESLPGKFVIGGSTVTISHGSGFGDYFDDGSPDNLSEHMGIAVHEVYHAYSSTMGHQLLVDTRAPKLVDAEALYVGRPPLLVFYSAHFPAREMHATFPRDAITGRYATYVSPSKPEYGTQQDGIFSLLDELTAYYHSSRVQLDLWPWVRDEAPGSRRLLLYYVQQIHKVGEPYAELKLWILHYLLHARDHHPNVYRELLANQSFRRAFAAVDDAYTALIAEARALEPTLHDFASARGVAYGLYQGQLTLDGRPFEVLDAAYPAVMRTLASKPYQDMLARLR